MIFCSTDIIHHRPVVVSNTLGQEVEEGANSSVPRPRVLSLSTISCHSQQSVLIAVFPSSSFMFDSSSKLSLPTIFSSKMDDRRFFSRPCQYPPYCNDFSNSPRAQADPYLHHGYEDEAPLDAFGKTSLSVTSCTNRI